MNHLVKMLSTDDGDLVPKEDQVWHFVAWMSDSPRTLCQGEVFGEGEGHAKFKERHVLKGGITCPQCLGLIKMFKAIKL